MNFTYGVICDHITALLIIYKLPDARSSGLHVESNAFFPALRILSPLGQNQIVSVVSPSGRKCLNVICNLKKSILC